ncbi:carbohydrate kinase family protein [Rhodohalobacter sp. 614A]|uniref:carbohydrate kinase family protein n=1 Tax=Rhodohalobacter sp. 614A TaxID=2908649 RepID=UPI001F441A71|nr:carbohydrate kinase family protein [Rhodohalobacter sp. 614A]
MSEGKTNDIMVIGELNVDLIFNQLNKAPEFGKEQRADQMTLTLGSSSAIFASNCSSLGSNVAFCGKVGGDSFGDFVMKSLNQKNVNADNVFTEQDLKTGATVIFNHEGDRMMVTHPGAMEHMTVDEIPDELFKKSRHLHTSAIFFQPGIKKDLVKMFSKAKEFGLTTSMDTQWDPEEKWEIDIEKILPVLDFFLPNEDELVALTGSSNLDEALEKIDGFDTCVIVKRGTKGALMQKNGEKTSINAYQVDDFVDAIGAGDSFDAGFISSFLKGKSLDESLKMGNLTAAVSTTAAGGTTAIKSFDKVIEKGKSLELSSS